MIQCLQSHTSFVQCWLMAKSSRKKIINSGNSTETLADLLPSATSHGNERIAFSADEPRLATSIDSIEFRLAARDLATTFNIPAPLNACFSQPL